MAGSRRLKKSKAQLHDGQIVRAGISEYSSSSIPSCCAARSRFQEGAFLQIFIFVNAQSLPMRGKSEVIAVQMFTGRGEIPFLRVIPTPNSNYPRTGNEEAKDDKWPLRREGFSQLRNRNAGLYG
jgi:hypothetical protein